MFAPSPHKQRKGKAIAVPRRLRRDCRGRNRANEFFKTTAAVLSESEKSVTRAFPERPARSDPAAAARESLVWYPIYPAGRIVTTAAAGRSSHLSWTGPCGGLDRHNDRSQPIEGQKEGVRD